MAGFGLPACTSSLVIFGGTGDLAHRKLIPALSRLRAAGVLPSDLHVISTGRREYGREELIASYREGLTAAFARDSLLRDGFETLARQIHYLRIFPERDGALTEFEEALKKIEGTGAAPVRLFYLAVPPETVDDFLGLLGGALEKGRDGPCPTRVLLEKPFGQDLPTARALNARLLKVAREEQIFRIDHYLGKEAVQNILVTRFGNVLFEPVWNRSVIDHVQISFAEEIGVGGRGPFYDQTGILRDVVQNHLLQVLSLIAMEPPQSYAADAIRTEKLKVLQAIRLLRPEEACRHTVRGRYLRSGAMPGYLEERGVASESTTETYVAMRVFLESWRWAGVPFYVRAGKRLSNSLTEVALFFRPVPRSIFPVSAGVPEPNALIIRVQPDEGIHLLVQSKIPGMSLKLGTVEMDFSYQKSFGAYRPDAYERLLLDALHGEASLFLRNDEIEAAWAFIDPIMAGWAMPGSSPVEGYAAGSDGPERAAGLIGEDGRSWRSLRRNP